MNGDVIEGEALRNGWFTGLVLTALLGSVLPAAGDVGSEDDYGRAKIGGNRGPIVWESLLHGDGLEGWRVDESPWPPPAWSREGNTLVCNATGTHPPRLTQGDSNWVVYEVKVQATPVNVGTMEIHFGISADGKEFYSLNYLSGWGAMAISRKDETGFTKLDVVNHVLHFGQEYDIVLAVRGRSITSYVDGQLINRLTVDTPPRGPIGLVVWGKHGIARFRDPKIRHYN